jgi:transposase
MKSDEIVMAAGGLFAETPIEVLVWDGAGSHRDGRLDEFGRPLVTLPPYSPELNPAERVFRELRKAIEGKSYATLDDKVAAVEAELAKYDADPARVRSVANWKWIAAALPEQVLDIAA